jgi:hypothetical protein
MSFLPSARSVHTILLTHSWAFPFSDSSSAINDSDINVISSNLLSFFATGPGKKCPDWSPPFDLMVENRDFTKWTVQKSRGAFSADKPLSSLHET